MKIRDLSEPLGLHMCMFNVPYGGEDYSSGYDSGKEAGYEKAKKEYEQKLKDKEQELIARGFGTTSVTGLYGAIESRPMHSLVSLEKTLKEMDANDFSKLLTTKTFLGDIPKQNNLPKSSKLCGYIEIDGTYHKCNSCEHETVIRKIIWENDALRKRYFETPAYFFDNMPRGMLQEEYFAMKDLGFVKISSFKDTPNDMVVFFYNNLTYKQSDIVYPR